MEIGDQLKKTSETVDDDVSKSVDQDYISGVSQITDHAEVQDYVEHETKA